MLRIRTLGATLLALSGSVGAAFAADVSGTYEPPPTPAYSPSPVWSWSGPYAGLQGGYGWSTATISPPGNATLNGWTGGIYGGYNFQTQNNFVFGIEGDVSGATKNGSNGTVSVKTPWNATIRGRAGYAIDRFMPYATGGLALGGITATSGGTSSSATKVGWVAGVGVEASLTDKITGRVEFRHTSFGSTTFSSLAGSPSVSTSSNDVLVGIGLKF